MGDFYELPMQMEVLDFLFVFIFILGVGFTMDLIYIYIPEILELFYYF